MNVIAMEEEAFYTLIDQVMIRLDKKKGATPEKWISCDEAMQKLRIKSKTTLQKYRDQGKIRYSQLDKKHILYDLDSINSFLALNARETF